MLQVPATVHVVQQTSQWDVHLIDISRAGVAFASARPLDDGALFRLSFWLPEGCEPCTADGTVVYCTEMGNNKHYRVGARFQLMCQETQEHIMNFATAPAA